MLAAVDRDDHALVPILILADDARLAQPPVTQMKERAQVPGVERIENAAHLIVAGHRPLNPIDAAQIVFFGQALLFEVEQRRRLE